MKTKTCNKCKHYKEVWDDGLYECSSGFIYMCKHKDVKDVCNVTGKEYYQQCSDARSENGACKPEGILFEELRYCFIKWLRSNTINTIEKIKPADYLVYKVLVDSTIVYVGEGRVGREKHAISGCSHVYELNKLHFEGVEVSVEIDSQHTTKSKAVKREAALIGKLQPIYNKKGKVRAALIDYIQKSKKKG